MISRDGYQVRIGDVARIEDSTADRETVASVNGSPAVVLQIRKQSGTNTIEVVQRVRERLENARPQLPAGWTMTVLRDESAYPTNAVHAVQEHLVLGAFFSAGIGLLFLRRFRPTIIAAVAIPASLIATFATMKFMGFSLNIITLLALALTIGILVDDSIVVIENISRHLEQGEEPRVAVKRAQGVYFWDLDDRRYLELQLDDHVCQYRSRE